MCLFFMLFINQFFSIEFLIVYFMAFFKSIILIIQLLLIHDKIYPGLITIIFTVQIFILYISFLNAVFCYFDLKIKKESN